MSKKVLDGAKLFCDKGSTSSSLKVLSQKIVTIDDKLVGTESDFNTGKNIPPFGICSITQKTCIPSTLKWTNTHKTDKINNNKVLLNTSECPCSLGGKIKPIHINYNGFASY